MIKKRDSLEFMKEQKDYSLDIVYSDPPYALGSEIVIRKDGKVDYAKAVDFMNKWDMPTGEWWEQWFKETYRTLKHGGYCIMFGMDRQLLLFKYFASLAGFQEQQSLYWFNISGFPKASDLSKNIDNYLGEEREKVRTAPRPETSGTMAYSGDTRPWIEKSRELGYHEHDGNTPVSNLAKKYEGYKYSVAPLKQTNETVMVFQKPYKTGSCLHDTLAYKKGDKECSCGALNIDGCRVGVETITQFTKDLSTYHGNKWGYSNKKVKITGSTQTTGRYPAQTFCDSNTAEVLDKQSGINKSSKLEPHHKTTTAGWGNGETLTQTNKSYGGDTGGCSKILHKCNYEKGEFDLYKYQPKVSRHERNAGLDSFNYLEFSKDVPVPQRKERPFYPVKNNHPTLKPIVLNERILRLFKTPNTQKICYPFAGAGSEIIGGIRAGFDNWIACELSQEYIDIANARIDYWGSKYTIIENKKIYSNEGLANAPEDSVQQLDLFNL